MLFLPVFLMGLLALGTYWMVRTTPDNPTAPVLMQHPNQPDYLMHSFSVKTFGSGGDLRSEVQGKLARHFPQTGWLDIEEIRIRSYDQNGYVTTASAQRGLTNQDGSEVQLTGDAIVVREGGNASSNGKAQVRTEYRGEFLHAFMDTEQVTSHKPVELRRGNDVFTADQMDFDNVQQVITFQGRVRGTLLPHTK